MAISRISSQDAQASGGTASQAVTYPGATTAGNLLIAIMVTNSGTTGANSISGWTLFGDVTISSAGNGSLSLLYNLADGTETTITANGDAGAKIAVDIFEYKGNANPISTDGNATATSGTSIVSSQATPAITTTNANDLIFSVVGQQLATSSSNAWGASSLIGFNQAVNIGTLIGGELIVSTIQTGFTDNLSWATGSRASAITGVFKAAVAPPVQFARAPTVMVIR